MTIILTYVGILFLSVSFVFFVYKEYGLSVVSSLLFGTAMYLSTLLKSLEDIKQQAINRNYAEYNPKTGEWGWKTNIIVFNPLPLK